MTGTNKIVLLSCGSFNPPTIMHFRMFEIARDYLHHMGRGYVIAGLVSPVHDSYSKENLVSSADRREMVRLATENSDWIYLSEWESRRNQWTPSRQVLQYHQDLVDTVLNANDLTGSRQKIGNWVRCLNRGAGPVQVKLLCGADLVESFRTPGLWTEDDMDVILGRYGLVVITRNKSDVLQCIYESDVLTRHARNIEIVTEWMSNDISSTKIRRAVSRGESIKYMVLDPVIYYINQHKLYQSNSSQFSPQLPTPSPNNDTDIMQPPPSSSPASSRDISPYRGPTQEPTVILQRVTPPSPKRVRDVKEKSRQKKLKHQRDGGENGDESPSTSPRTSSRTARRKRNAAACRS